MITNRRLFIGVPLATIVVAILILGVLQWRSNRVVIEVGFWFDGVTFEVSPLDVQQLGGPVTEEEKAMIREVAWTELRTAYSKLRVRLTDNRKAHYRIRVVQGPIEGVSRMARGAAGQTTALGPMGGDSTVSYLVSVRGAFAYAPAGATRRDILEGIGRGLGRTAVHELGHQLLGTQSAHGNDARSYEYGSPDRIGQYYGPIHWDTAWAPLEKRLGQ